MLNEYLIVCMCVCGGWGGGAFQAMRVTVAFKSIKLGRCFKTNKPATNLPDHNVVSLKMALDLTCFSQLSCTYEYRAVPKIFSPGRQRYSFSYFGGEGRQR